MNNDECMLRIRKEKKDYKEMILKNETITLDKFNILSNKFYNGENLFTFGKINTGKNTLIDSILSEKENQLYVINSFKNLKMMINEKNLFSTNNYKKIYNINFHFNKDILEEISKNPNIMNFIKENNIVIYLDEMFFSIGHYEDEQKYIKNLDYFENIIKNGIQVIGTFYFPENETKNLYSYFKNLNINVTLIQCIREFPSNKRLVKDIKEIKCN